MEDLPEFYRENNVEVIASLPYYIENDVDSVRGNGTFRKSIVALQRLNQLGYGTNSGGTEINLVYNPKGAFLPSQQSALEAEYKKELFSRFGITFNKLYTFANMPIGRFRNFLSRTGNFERYMEKLKSSFNPSTLDGIMCRHILNVGCDGRLYDCDFNQMIGLGLCGNYPVYIKDFDYKLLSQRKIALDDHCFGCTAGQGST
jgi:radical SAM/Cys-rich protein